MTTATTHVPELTKEEHVAIKALAEGEANPGQQVLALAVIVKKLSQPQDLLYIAGSFDETSFLNGRAFIASQIRRLIKIPVRDN